MDKLFSLHMDKMRSTLKILSNKQIGEVIRSLFEYQDTGENKKISEEQIVVYAYEILQQSLIYLNEKRTGFSEAQRNRVNKRWGKDKKGEERANTGEYPGIENDTPEYHGMSDEAEKVYRGISGNTENTNTVTVTETATATEKDTAKETEKDVSEASPLNDETLSASQVLKKPKKLPLREREPVNDMERVEKAYLQNWDILFSQGKVKTANPVVNWNQTRKLLKTHFEKIESGLIIQAIENGMRNDWVMNSGYSLGTMLAAGTLNQLINATGTKNVKGQSQHRIAADYIPPEKVDEYFQ